MMSRHNNKCIAKFIQTINYLHIKSKIIILVFSFYPLVSVFPQCAEMDIIGNGMSISSGDDTPDIIDDTDFGVLNFGDFEEHTFTIENTGNLDLNLTGIPLVEITNSTDFTVTLNPSSVISSSGGLTVFTLRYEPSMAGTINTATISISNDDCDENPYVFDVLGESTSTLNIENQDLIGRIKLYPNPSNAVVNLKYSGNELIQSMTLYEISGKEMKRFSFSDSRHHYSIDLRHLNGIYFLRIKTKTSQTLKKLIIN